MAADSKFPSLRSSARLSHPEILRAALHRPGDKAPTGPATNAATATRLGKRVRTPLGAHDGPRAAKAIKTEHRNGLPAAQETKFSGGGGLSAEPAAKASRGRGVAPLPPLRVTSAVQPRPDGAFVAEPGPATLRNGATQTDDDLPAVAVNGSVSEKSDRRTLRSHDGGSRSKSELALYFPNYDDFINPEPQENDLLIADTRLYITDEPPKSPTSAPHFILASPTRTSPSKPLTSPTLPSLKPPSSPTAFRTLDIPTSPGPRPRDPLADARFARAHGRAERQEKQLRNIEKERAQHEKVQLERLLEGLRGPDWLRVMGISGVVEGERRRWDAKRAFFVREVRALIDKFRRWKEEERRRKVERDASVRDEDEEEDEDEDEDGEESEAGSEMEAEGSDDGGRQAPLPESSHADVDALAALQLHHETLHASGAKPVPRRRGLSAGAFFAPMHPPADRPFTSFFAKPHQRAAALERTRRTGRTRFAFGQPVPDVDEREFGLPPDYITPQALRASARSRRLQRRNVQPGRRPSPVLERPGGRDPQEQL